MSDTSGESYLDLAGLNALSATLATDATVLDETAAHAPHAPDAGVSTPLVGGLLAEMSVTVSDLVTAVDVTSANVQRSAETFTGADSAGARQFSALGD